MGYLRREDDELLTIKEVPAVLRIHPTTLYRLAKQARFPPFELAVTGDFVKTRSNVGPELSGAVQNELPLQLLPHASTLLSAVEL